MPIELRELVDQLNPTSTVLLFGAGASMPSGAPSVADLIHDISKEFNIDPDGLSLSEIAAVAEMKRNRTDLIGLVRKRFKGLKAKSALLNLPRHEWKSIYSTNYDELVEDAYHRAEKNLQVFASDFDFKIQPDPTATKYFKIHGTISKDTVDGSVFNLILTQMDYDVTADYREALYARLRSDMNPGSQGRSWPIAQRPSSTRPRRDGHRDKSEGRRRRQGLHLALREERKPRIAL